MVISKLNIDKIERNLSLIQGFLSDIERFIREISTFIETYKKATAIKEPREN